MTIKLRDLAGTPEDVEFPNGTIHKVVPFDAVAYELFEAIEQNPHDEASTLALLQRCVPTATERDIATLTPRMVVAIVANARGQLDLLMANPEAFLGNVEAVARILRSRPPTPSAASAPRSPRRKAARSGTSSGSRITKRSTRT